MYWPSGVPGDATRLTYAPLNSRKSVYFVWRRPRPLHEGHRWGWWALGNNGFCNTEDDAKEICRRWIRDRQ